MPKKRLDKQVSPVSPQNMYHSSSHVKREARITDQKEDEEIISYQNDQAEDVFDDYGNLDDYEEEEKKAGSSGYGRQVKKTNTFSLSQEKGKNPRSELSTK